MAESFADQLSCVRQMASGDPLWDLSPNERAALKAVLESRDMHSDFMAFMSAELAKFPCMCEAGSHSGTAPMMWPELIQCIVKRAVTTALEKERANG